MSAKVCLIGCGYWGANILRVLNSTGNLVACFDKDKKAIDKYKSNKLYKDVYFDTDWEKCLGRDTVKGIVVATPPDSHYEIAMNVLRAGKHVFIEKPMTLNAEEAEIIVSYAKERDLIVMVGHVFLYSPEILKLKKVISSEDFGDILYVYTKRLNLGQVQSCGVVQDLLPHDISIINFLLDKKCSSISVYGVSHILKGVEDIAFINMKYDNISVNAHLSWLDPNKVRDTVVVGSKQMAVCDSIDKKISIYNKSIDIGAMEEAMSVDYARHLLCYCYGDIVQPYIEAYEPLAAECKEFIDCIRENRMPLANGELGLNVVEVLEAAKNSLNNNGAWIEIC